STCAHDGKRFARYWVHNGLVNMGSEKMSKSTGNLLRIRDLLEAHDGEVLRLALLTAHYRQPLEWTAQLVDESRQKLDRLYGSLHARAEMLGRLERSPKDWFSGRGAHGAGQDDAEIDALVARREALRKERKFAEADAIRDELASAGIVIEDVAGGSRWRRTR